MTTGNSYGRPYANGRGCKIEGGNKAFGWNWNVANRRVVFAHDDKGVLHLIHISGSDTNVVFRYLNGAFYAEGIGKNPVAISDPKSTVPNNEPQILRSGERFFLDQYEIKATISGPQPVSAPPQIEDPFFDEPVPAPAPRPATWGLPVLASKEILEMSVTLSEMPNASASGQYE